MKTSLFILSLVSLSSAANANTLCATQIQGVANSAAQHALSATPDQRALSARILETRIKLAIKICNLSEEELNTPVVVDGSENLPEIDERPLPKN